MTFKPITNNKKNRCGKVNSALKNHVKVTDP